MSKAPLLYTSALRLKQALRTGREMPPMTPLPPAAREIFDPAFTISGDGWGGILETDDGKLVCPVKRCGGSFAHLALHIYRAHPELGVSRFRELMGIPSRVPLLSEVQRKKLGEITLRDIALGKRHTFPRGHSGYVRERRPRRTGKAACVGWRNLYDTCDAQLKARITLLHSEIGRTPTCGEFAMRFGDGSLGAVKTHFGTWNHALARCGMPVRKRGYSLANENFFDLVIEALRAWVGVHGDLPRSSARGGNQCVPYLPTYTAILRAFKTDSWKYAMQQAAAILGIEGGRYGLPVRAA